MAGRDRVETINETEPRKPERTIKPVELSEGRRSRRDLVSASDDAEAIDIPSAPLPPPKPPLAGPEMDSDESVGDEPPFTPKNWPGIDPGLLPRMDPGDDEGRENGDGDVEERLLPKEPEDRRPANGPRPPGEGGEGNNDEDDRDETDYGIMIPNGTVPFPYAPDFGPNMVNVDGVPTIVPDVNVYQNKKTLAQGMMDLALLSANANQLRYVLESYSRHPYYYVSIFFISVSLIIQIAVGVGLILNTRYNVKNDEEICKANKINNLTVLGVFLITVVNVFVSAFGVAETQNDIKPA